MKYEKKYTSIFSPNKKVNSAQYIVELVCKNKADFLKIELPTQFWSMPEWANFYKLQLKHSYLLLEKYDDATLISVIRTKNIFSLSAKWIENEFIKEKKRIKNQVLDTEYTRILDSKGLQNKKKDFGKFDG